jgi:signal transduction histidine kinase
VTAPCRPAARHRRHHLFRRIYGALLGGALLAMLLVAGLASLAWDHEPPPAVQGGLSALFDDLPPAGDPALDGRVGDLARRLHSDLTLRDGAGRVVASSGPALPDGDPGWWNDRSGAGVRVALDDGRRLTLATRGPHRPVGFFFSLAAIAALFAVIAWPVSRRLSRRLEALRDGVAAWGPADLSARVAVDGDDEVADVAAAFNHAADRVERLVESDRRMLASASHELRSPLARIRLALSLLDDGDPARGRWVAEAARDVEELDQTVGDLLQVGRLQALGPAARAPVDLLALLREVVPAAAGPELHPTADAALLRRLLRNLVDNAVRHGGGEVEAWTTPTGFVVADRGPGVPADQVERIFEPFYRPAGHAEGRDGGVGLGLWLVREIALAHGGDVTVSARDGGGSVFEVRLG